MIAKDCLIAASMTAIGGESEDFSPSGRICCKATVTTDACDFIPTRAKDAREITTDLPDHK